MIAQVLTRHRSTAKNAASLAAAAAVQWQNMAQQLAPLIGNKGMHALYLRSLELTSNTHPWLCQAEAAAHQSPFTALELVLSERDMEEAVTAAELLMRTFSKQLVSLIGESLATELSRNAWQESLSSQTRQSDH